MYDMFGVSVFIICCAAVILYSFLQLDSVIATVLSLIYTIFAFIAVQVSKMPDPYKEDDVGYNWETIKPI